MNEMNPEAVYDVLYISSRLQRKIDDFSMSEIQFFSYFSCLLSLYDGNDSSSWNYSYIRAEFGMPYSTDVHKALHDLCALELILESPQSAGFFTITPKGQDFLRFNNENISLTRWRRKYLDTACDSISLLPFGTVKDALNDEPVLRSASRSSMKRNLLVESNPAIHVLYEQFAALREALSDDDADLIIPAVVWLQGLSKEQNQSEKS